MGKVKQLKLKLKKKSKTILEIVKRKEGATSPEIEEETGESKQIIRYHLKQYCKEGIIFKTGEKRKGGEIYVAIPKDRVPDLNILKLIIQNMGFNVKENKGRPVLEKGEGVITKDVGIPLLLDFCCKRDAAFGGDSFEIILQFLKLQLDSSEPKEHYPLLLCVLQDLTAPLREDRIFKKKRKRIVDEIGTRLIEILKEENCHNLYLILYAFSNIKTTEYVESVLELTKDKNYNELRGPIVVYFKSIIKDKKFWIPSEIIQRISQTKDKQEKNNLQDLYAQIAGDII